MAAKNLKPGYFISFSNFPWKEDTTFDGGWFSGILDGEGTVSKGSISVSQKKGLVLDKIKRILTKKRIKYNMATRK